MSLPTIQTPRLRLGPYRADDKPALLRHADDPEVARWLRDRFPSPYTAADADRFLALCAADGPGEALFAIRLEDEAIGGIGLHRHGDVHRHTAELGYWLGRAHWGKGYASEAVAAILPHAFDTLALVRVEATCFEGNEASRRVLERNGFTCEGRTRMSVYKAGRFHDQWIYARIREPGPGAALQ
ncbi:MAG: GNAT family protein [Planctomycetota bacterium]